MIGTVLELVSHGLEQSNKVLSQRGRALQVLANLSTYPRYLVIRWTGQNGEIKRITNWKKTELDTPCLHIICCMLIAGLFLSLHVLFISFCSASIQ